MAHLKADSPLCRRIVLSFLDFLNSVEPASLGDVESLEVAKDCLLEAFKIDSSSIGSVSKSDSLIEIFSSQTAEEHEVKSDLTHEGFRAGSPSSFETDNAVDAETAGASECLGHEGRLGTQNIGTCEDELFGQFFGALEKVHFFAVTPDGHDDQVQLDRATNLFHNALVEMKKSGCKQFDLRNLAETFKSQGNKAMQSKLYSEAIELYTVAIALCDDNAVYYCNRAAAYTQAIRYTEAIHDCLKSIAIDPNYGKAYSRLGFAYYAQGNYRDAIDKGFMKALQLDPNNESVKSNIWAAEQKLKEQQRTEHAQSSSSASHPNNEHFSGGSSSHASFSSFTSMPFNINGLPSDVASMLRNMTTNVHQGQHFQGRPEGGSNSTDAFSEPEIRGGNIHVNLGDQMPQELSGALRSVMQMFSGGTSSHVNSQENENGGSASR